MNINVEIEDNFSATLRFAANNSQIIDCLIKAANTSEIIENAECKCEWKYDEDTDSWETGCDGTFMFDTDESGKNRCSCCMYCMYCGRKIEIVTQARE